MELGLTLQSDDIALLGSVLLDVLLGALEDELTLLLETLDIAMGEEVMSRGLKQLRQPTYRSLLDGLLDLLGFGGRALLALLEKRLGDGGHRRHARLLPVVVIVVNTEEEQTISNAISQLWASERVQNVSTAWTLPRIAICFASRTQSTRSILA